MSCDIRHGLELIAAFLDERAENELKKIFYFAQPNSYNLEKTFPEFKHLHMSGSLQARAEDDILREVQGILAQFRGEEAGGNI